MQSKGLSHSLRMSMREGVNSLMWDMRHSRVCTQTHILTHCSIHTHILTAAHTHVSGRTTDCVACRQLTTSTACPWQYIDDNDFHYNVLIAWCVRSGDRPSARCTHSLTSFVADYTLTVCDTWHTCLLKLLRGEQVVSKTWTASYLLFSQRRQALVKRSRLLWCRHGYLRERIGIRWELVIPPLPTHTHLCTCVFRPQPAASVSARQVRDR